MSKSKSKRTVLKSLALITQLGIMMMTPIALCVAIGLFIDYKAGTNWVFIPFMVLGVVSGFTTVYKTVMNVVKQDEAEKAENADPVTEKLMQSLNRTPYEDEADTIKEEDEEDNE